MSTSTELVLDAQATLGEGAIWDAKRQALLWIDIVKQQVHIYNPSTQENRTIQLDQMVGTVVPRQSGGLMVAVHHGFASLDLETEEMEIVADPEHDQPENRFNDGKCDPAGRFWAGTLSLKGKRGTCNLWRLDADLSVHKMIEGVSVSNGIVWTADRTAMYYVDTPTHRVDRFDYDHDTGEIANRSVAVRIPEGMGSPDGMTIDSEGMLWVCLWQGGKVSRWDPKRGELLQTVDLPASNVTSCAFGGVNLEQLYITTARINVSDEQLQEQPLAGGLFRADVGVSGMPAFEFAG
jgi:sugar lactone lactonase YvrE